MRRRLSGGHIPLKVILAAFWSGTVAWSQLAQGQLDFWKSVNFLLLMAPISADVLGKSIELTFKYPTVINASDVSVMYQDASASASGGGMLFRDGYHWCHSRQFSLYRFSTAESDFSSTLREILGILKSLIASERLSKLKIIFACDNMQSVLAIKYGSRIPEIQKVAEDIFIWCMKNGKICWPVWLPRTHPVIKEADRRSRLPIPHDQRSPKLVVAAANKMALELWGRPLSFDQMASHRSAITVDNTKLPFNAFCHQDGAAGVDSFTQWVSWEKHVNYVYPPEPMTGRLLTFLPSTNAVVITAIPLPLPCAWWTFTVLKSATGVVGHGSNQNCQLLDHSLRFSGKSPPPNSNDRGVRIACCVVLLRTHKSVHAPS